MACIFCLKIKKGEDITCPKHSFVNIKPLKIKDSFFGPTESTFVGRYGYPSVNIGPIGSIVGQGEPSEWFKLGYGYNELIQKRSFTVHGKYKEDIFSNSRYIEANQEIAMAVNNPDTEMKFSSKPTSRLIMDSVLTPTGPSAKLKSIKIVDNPKIPKKIDYIVKDDLTAEEQINSLYKNTEVYKTTTIMSSGVLGRNNKIVPTRWSITAVDDTIAKILIRNVRYYEEINDYRVCEAEYLGNHFVILLMPGKWEFENFETWFSGSNWSSGETTVIGDYENYYKKKEYSNQAGGYYSARLGVLEYLEKISKQCRVFSIREISSKYNIPMGVWVVRETAREAMKNIKKFSTFNEAVSYMKTKIKYPFEEYRKISKILMQSRLDMFIR